MASDDYIYLDENGNEVSPSEIDEELDTIVDSAYPEVSTWNLLKRGAANVPAYLYEQASGLEGMIGTGLKGLGFQGLGSRLVGDAAVARDQVSRYRDWTQEQFGKYPTEPYSVSSFIESAPTMAADLATMMALPAAGASWVARMLPAALAIGGKTAGTEYQNLLEGGVDPETASQTALLAGGIGAGSAALPIPYMNNPELTRLKRAGVSALGNSIIGAGQGVATKAAEELVADRDYTPRQYWDSLLYDGLTSAPVGAAVGYGLHDPISRRGADRIRTEMPEVQVDSVSALDPGLQMDPGLQSIGADSGAAAPAQAPEPGLGVMSADQFREQLRQAYGPKPQASEPLPQQAAPMEAVPPPQLAEPASQFDEGSLARMLSAQGADGWSEVASSAQASIEKSKALLTRNKVAEDKARASAFGKSIQGQVATKAIEVQRIQDEAPVVKDSLPALPERAPEVRVEDIEVQPVEPPAPLATTPRDSLDLQVESLINNAQAFNPEFQAKGKAVADSLGWGYEAGPVKDAVRLKDKTVTLYNGDISRNKDVVRGMVLIPNWDEFPKLVQAVKSQFGDSAFVKANNSTNTGKGYKSEIISVPTPWGVGEIQATTPDHYFIKQIGPGRDLYKAARNPHTSDKARRIIEAAMVYLYPPAESGPTPLKRSNIATSSSHLSKGTSIIESPDKSLATSLPEGLPKQSRSTTRSLYDATITGALSSEPLDEMKNRPFAFNLKSSKSIDLPPDPTVAQPGTRTLLPNERVEAAIESWLPGKPGESVQINPTVRNLAPKSIVARPKIMQFREGANADGVTSSRKIRDGYQNVRRKPLWVWEPKDPAQYGMAPGEQYIVVDGHHGLDAAKTSDVDSVSTIILRETDGIDPQMAMMLGAERNVIKAGRGNSTFREAFRFGQMGGERWGKDVLAERAKSYGPMGQEAAIVGANAVPEVYQGYLKGVVNEAQTSSIVKSSLEFGQTPTDVAELQQLGLAIANYSPQKARAEGSAYLDGNKYNPLIKELFKDKALSPKLKTVEGIRDVVSYVSNARIEAGAGDSGGWNAVFGNNAGFKIDTAEIVAKQEWRRTLEGALTGAKANERLVGKDLSFAGQEAGKVTDVDRKAKFEREARETLYKLDKSSMFPDVKQQLQKWKDWIAGGKKGEMPTALLLGLESASGKLQGDNSGGFGPLFNRQNEIGSTPIFSELAYRGQEKVKDMLGMIPGKRADSNPADEFLNRNLLLGPIRKQFTFMRTMAKKFGNTKGGEGLKVAWDGTLKGVESKAMVQFDAWQALEPYYGLSETSQARIGNLVYAAQEKAVDVGNSGRLNLSDQALLQQHGFSEAEVSGYKAVRDWLNGQALDYLEIGLINKAKRVVKDNGETRLEVDSAKVAEIKDYINVLKSNQHYAPLGRYGNRDVILLNKDGTLAERYFAENNRQEQSIVKDAIKRGYDLQTQIVRETVKRTEDVAYENLPANIQPGLVLGDVAPDLDPRGFNKHLVAAKHIPGASKDLGRALAEYVTGLSNFVSANQMRAEFSLAKAISPTKSIGDMGPLGFIKRFEDNIMRPSSKNLVNWSSVNQAAALYFLGYRLSTAMINMTQPITTTTPLLAKYFPAKAEVVSLRSYGQATSYLLRPKEFAKGNPEMVAQLDALKRNGWLDQNIKDEFGLRANPSSGVLKNLASDAMAFQAVAEKLNRTHAAVAAYHAAQVAKIPPAEISTFMRDFVNDTQFIQGKLGRPAIAQEGIGSSALMFKTWTGNWLRLLRDQSPKDFQVWGRMIGYMLALGGTQALPFVNLMSQGLEALGINPRALVREHIGNNKVADVVMYGLPNALNVNIGRAVGFGDIVDVSGSAPETAIKVMLGPLSELFFAPKRAIDNLQSGNTLRAVESVMPTAARRVMATERVNREGFRTPQGDPVWPNPEIGSGPLAEQPSWLDKLLYGIGFTPTPLANAYEYQGAKRVLAEEAKGVSDGAGVRIGQARFNGDMDAVRAEFEDLMSRWESTEQSVRPPLSKVLDGVLQSSQRNVQRRAGVDVSYPASARPALRELQKLYQ